MPKVSGQPALYLRQEAEKKRRRMVVNAFWCIGLMSAIAGFLFGTSLHRISVPPLVSVLISTVCLGVSWFWSNRTIAIVERIHRERLNLDSGVSGESSVAFELSKLPMDYHVLHDIDAGYGNLDHVVIGPTGVFIIDAKNWRGVISSNEDGGMLLNGKPMRDAKQLVGRIMGVKDRLNLCERHPTVYFQAVFVFTSARVEAKWGSTGPVHCIREDQLLDYILDKKSPRLTHDEIEKISSAFIDFQDEVMEVLPTGLIS